MARLCVAIVLCATLLGMGPDVATGPQPSPTPISWELKFDFLHPRRIEVLVPGEDQPTTYWYMVYTVTNPTPRAQHFFPIFQLVTDDLRVIDTDMGISPAVFDAIRERHRLTHPYLVSPTDAIGELLTGDDYARESVAVWRADVLDVNRFWIYVAGLSGEARAIPNPAYEPGMPEEAVIIGPHGGEIVVKLNPREFTIRKTLELSYELPGSESGRRLVDPVFQGRRWIMR